MSFNAIHTLHNPSTLNERSSERRVSVGLRGAAHPLLFMHSFS